MEPLKQISAKIDPITLEKIDKMARSWPYHKRNAIINGILSAVFKGMSSLEIDRMIRYAPWYDVSVKITISMPETRENKPDGNENY